MVDDVERSGLPTEADMIARAKEMAPQFVERRRETLDLRRIPDQSIEELTAAGMFKIMQPRRLGGFELPFGTHTSVSAELAKACGATGWVVCVIATHHWMVGKFDPQAQADVWQEQPDALVASAFASWDAKVEPVSNGYRISGRWRYSSGIDAASWAMVVIPVPQNDGPPEMRFSLVPRQDFQVEDTWRSVGLRGSGSNDILISNVFVPSYRTLSFAQSDQIDSPGTAVNDGPVYRLPTFGVFNLCAVGPALGLAQGALDAFLDDISRRTNLQNSKIAQFMTMQIRVSEASAEIDSALLLYLHTVDVIRKAAQRGQGIEQGELLKIQRDCAYMSKLCQRAVERLVDVMGAGGLTEDNFVQLALADIKGACAHITMVWDANAVPYGKHLLGIPQ